MLTARQDRRLHNLRDHAFGGIAGNGMRAYGIAQWAVQAAEDDLAVDFLYIHHAAKIAQCGRSSLGAGTDRSGCPASNFGKPPTYFREDALQFLLWQAFAQDAQQAT